MNPAVNCLFTEMVKTDSLKPNPRNPNKHPDKQLELYGKIIAHQGWRKAIVVSKLSGLIVKGHGALLAAQRMDWDEVPIEYQEYASAEDETADMLADNRLAELADLDLALTCDLLLGFEVKDITGFTDEEFKTMMDKITGPTDFKEVDENIETAHTCPKCGYKWSGGE